MMKAVAGTVLDRDKSHWGILESDTLGSGVRAIAVTSVTWINPPPSYSFILCTIRTIKCPPH